MPKDAAARELLDLTNSVLSRMGFSHHDVDRAAAELEKKPEDRVHQEASHSQQQVEETSETSESLEGQLEAYSDMHEVTIPQPEVRHPDSRYSQPREVTDAEA